MMRRGIGGRCVPCAGVSLVGCRGGRPCPPCDNAMQHRWLVVGATLAVARINAMVSIDRCRGRRPRRPVRRTMAFPVNGGPSRTPAPTERLSNLMHMTCGRGGTPPLRNVYRTPLLIFPFSNPYITRSNYVTENSRGGGGYPAAAVRFDHRPGLGYGGTSVRAVRRGRS